MQCTQQPDRLQSDLAVSAAEGCQRMFLRLRRVESFNEFPASLKMNSRGYVFCCMLRFMLQGLILRFMLNNPCGSGDGLRPLASIRFKNDNCQRNHCQEHEDRQTKDKID